MVILNPCGDPSTTRTGIPDRSTRIASSVTSGSSAVCAARSVPTRNPCGVCTATSSSRGGVSTTTPSRTRLIVSATGTAGTTASDSASASITRSKTSAGAKGRAASWMSTWSSSPTTASPDRTDSSRVAPPATTTTARPVRPAATAATSAAGTTTTVSVIRATESAVSRQCSTRLRPPTSTSALGTPAASRVPLPAATRMSAVTDGPTSRTPTAHGWWSSRR